MAVSYVGSTEGSIVSDTLYTEKENRKILDGNDGGDTMSAAATLHSLFFEFNDA